MHVAVYSTKVCTKGFPVRSLHSAPEIRSSLYSAQMRAPPNLEYLRGEAGSVAAQNPLIRLLVLHTAMCVPMFSFIGLNFKRGQNRPY